MNLSRHLKQTCVYWPPLETDGWQGGGRVPPGYPVELPCRWIEDRRSFVNRAGREAVCRAVIYLGQDVSPGGWLFLGALADLPDGGDENPASVPGAFPVEAFEKVPDLSATNFLRKAIL